MRVRAAQSSDADALYELVCLSLKDAAPARGVFAASLERALADGTRVVAVACAGDALVGFADLYTVRPLCAAAPEGHVAQLYVREECRGKNAGTALLIFLSQRAKALGCGMLTLTASPVNLRVEPFLERNGFVRAMRWYTHPLH